MPQSIQRIPYGMLDALGIQSTGSYPALLSDQVAPCFELLTWYLESISSILISGSVAATGSGDFTTAATELTVPDGELWWCDSLTHQLTGAAGVSGQMNGYIRTPSGATFTRQRATPPASLQLAAATDLVLISQGPFFMRSGERPGARCHLSAAAGAFSWAMRVARLKI
jgi:hypothetical protein